MSWGTLFERANEYEASVDDVRAALANRRDAGDTTAAGDAGRAGETASDARTSSGGSGGTETDGTVEPSPARVVADADVLAADLLAGGAARDALDHVRAHSWVTLVASDALLDDAETIVADLADPSLAADWRRQIRGLRAPVDHPAGDHPALASAYRGGAMHVLTFDESLQSASAGAALRPHVETSVKRPRAFATLFDPESLHEAVEDGEYTGPDHDPRA